MATYYMRADGTAANKAAATGPGSTQANCMNITVHNGETFAANDVIVICDDGGVFRGQITVPSSGTSGNVITYQAETGDTPIISGADVISTWTSHEVNLLSNADFEDWADPSFPDGWVKEGTHDASNYVEEAPANDLHLVSDGTWTGLKFAANLSEGATYNYSIKVDTATSGSIKLRFGGSGDDVVITGTGTHTGSQADQAGDNHFFIVRNVACDYVIDEVKVSLPGYWQATVTTQPTAVWFDGVQGTGQASIAACTSARDWYWSSNVLYTYSSTDPDSAYTTIEATSRTSNIDTNDKSYITIDGLEVTKAKNQGIHISATNAIRPTNVIIQNCSITNQDLYGIYIGDSAADILTPNDVTIQNNIISLWYRSVQGAAAPDTITAPAIYQDDGDMTGGDNLTISNNTITGDMAMGVSNNYRDGIKIFTGDNIIIEENEIDQSEHGIHIYGSGSANAGTETYTIRYNYIHDTSDDFIWIVESSQTDSVVHGNICTNSGDNGFHLQASSISYGSFYNNVIDTTDNAAIFVVFGMASTNFKNNIIMNYGTDGSGGDACAIFLSTGTTTYGAGSSFDYNLYYKSGDSTPFFETTLTTRTLVQWQSDMSDEASSLNSDPLFTDASNDNFTLKANSPAKDGGVAISSYNDRLVPGSSWPDAVFTMEYSGAIGAYGFISRKQDSWVTFDFRKLRRK